MPTTNTTTGKTHWKLTELHSGIWKDKMTVAEGDVTATTLKRRTTVGKNLCRMFLKDDPDIKITETHNGPRFRRLR